jgi:hypothetical protein
VRVDGVPLNAPTTSLAVVAKTLVGVEGLKYRAEPQIHDRDDSGFVWPKMKSGDA